MNKLISTKKTSATFLAVILVAGTIALSYPSFMVGAAQAQPDYGMNQKYNSYEPDYGMNQKYNSYEPDYGMNQKYNSYEPDYGMDNDKKPQIFPANKVSKLGDRWWQWAFELDRTAENNPFTNLEQAGCDVGLQDNGKLLFLVGTNKDFTTYPDNGFPVHECVVKKGTAILFPIVNVACNNLEVGTPFFGEDEEEQRICANDLIDKFIPNSLHVNIDGKEIKNPEQYRIDSPAGGFEFTAVENNPFFTPPGDGIGVSDGFWILLEHLKPGLHTIEFSGSLDLRDLPEPFNIIFEAGATYNLFVEPGYY